MNIHEEITVKDIDHLGLVAGLIDDLGIVEHINQLVGEQPGEIVSAGLAVKAMIINGLGLVSAPLYLFPKFFEGKDTEHLIGEGIQPEHLNDYRLGRVLDQLYLVGVSQIFTIIALAAAQKFEVKVETSHLDSSSFHLHGNYDFEHPSVAFGAQNSPEDESNSSASNDPIPPVPISITYGYSRDHRPDLPQFIVQLICTGDGDVPLFLKVASGNESDSAVFASIIMEFKNQLNLDSLMVADSALYTAPNLSILTGCRWLSRVPQRLKQAQQLVSQLSETDFIDSGITGYRSSEHKSNYGGVLQRWLVVESSARLESDRRKLAKNIKKSEVEAQKQIRKLSSVEFACEADAVAAANHFSQQLKYYNLSDIKTIKSVSKADVSSPNHSEACPLYSIFKVQAKVELDTQAIAKETKKSGRFILATNIMDAHELTADEMIIRYKEQQSTERGFRFLKDPQFFTDSVFLKSPERIEALALMMGLCLLVYTLGQRFVRQSLQKTNSNLKNQLRKGTNKPTLRWIFQCFQSIHVLAIQGIKQISNLTTERMNILNFFPVSCRSYYLLL